MNKKIFYLWRLPETDTFFITDYNEVNAEGLVKVDNHGCLKVELVHQSTFKGELILFAQNMVKL